EDLQLLPIDHCSPSNAEGCAAIEVGGSELHPASRVIGVPLDCMAACEHVARTYHHPAGLAAGSIHAANRTPGEGCVVERVSIVRGEDRSGLMFVYLTIRQLDAADATRDLQRSRETLGKEPKRQVIGQVSIEARVSFCRCRMSFAGLNRRI